MTRTATFKGILGTKLGMTQIFDENARVVPVTVIQAGPNTVTQVKSPERDGYSAVQLAFGDVKARKVTKPKAGQFAKAGLELAACGNSMKTQNVTVKELLPGFIAADRGGVVRIAELQAQGYLYLRP